MTESFVAVPGSMGSMLMPWTAACCPHSLHRDKRMYGVLRRPEDKIGSNRRAAGSAANRSRAVRTACRSWVVEAPQSLPVIGRIVAWIVAAVQTVVSLVASGPAFLLALFR